MPAIKFVEDKVIDWKRIQEYLQLSFDTNHWTNFGPVSTLLERTIHENFALDDSLSVVMCSSGTTALNTLVELHCSLKQKELKWVVSSYGFYCTIQGPLRNAKVVDCNLHGMFDLHLLADQEYDGIVVTNIFGLHPNLEEYAQFCRENKKILICDSAKAFDGVRHGPNEIISFHHTKPWGMGEGGCAIVEKKYEEDFRALINFGLKSEMFDRRGTNAKLSDISSAFILQRVEDLWDLTPIYREQYRRIAKIAHKCEYQLISGNVNHPGTPSNVPLLAPHPISHIDNPYINLRKYYKPLEETPIAHDLYSRIINIPCHPGLQALPDRDIEDMLNTLAHTGSKK